MKAGPPMGSTSTIREVQYRQTKKILKPTVTTDSRPHCAAKMSLWSLKLNTADVFHLALWTWRIRQIHCNRQLSIEQQYSLPLVSVQRRG
jgi:hypothetical protein